MRYLFILPYAVLACVVAGAAIHLGVLAGPAGPVFGLLLALLAVAIAAAVLEVRSGNPG